MLSGAGATFPFPLISAVAGNYSRVNASVRINYQAIGSGAGVSAFTSKTVDFAASDAPLTPAQTSALPSPALHVPETIGAVVLAYNVPGIPIGLKLNATVIAKIFQGNITMWNDLAIAKLNPSLYLPPQQIIVVHRSDGAGTTFVFTEYLNSAASNVWRLGQSTVVPWPVGLGASGNQGVAGVVMGTAYTIGYVEFAYALNNHLQYANVLNNDGNAFVQPSLESISFAVSNVTVTIALPRGNQSWASVSLLNAHGHDSYPIVSFSYILVYQDAGVVPASTLEKAVALASFLLFFVGQGQMLGVSLGYVPIPATVLAIDEESILSLKYNGQLVANAIPPPVSPPILMTTPTSVRVDIDGTIGWTVSGLSNAVADLNVSHQVSLSVSPVPGISFVPITESGSFEQSINLSTRIESPGTATRVLSAIARSLLSSSGFLATNPFIRTLPQAQGTSANSYTIWWVNGPLSIGSPVQIMTGWADVTGDENLNLGALGVRPAWIVTSSVSQSLTVNNPLGGTTNASFNLVLLWSFDKSSDLLLRDNATITVMVHSVGHQTIFANPCGPTGYCPSPVSVTVTRDVSASLNLAMKLISTDVRLKQTGQGVSPLLSFLMASPWMTFGFLGVAAAAVAGVGVWLARRTQGRAAPSQPLAPPTTPPSTPAKTTM